MALGASRLLALALISRLPLLTLSTDRASHMMRMWARSAAPRRYIIIRGASGVNAQAINGDYVDSGKTYNGMPLYAKEGDSERYLRYVTARGLNQWRVGSQTSMLNNDDKGYIYCAEANLDDPADAAQWYVWSGDAWELQDSVSVLSSGGSTAKALAAASSGRSIATPLIDFLRACFRWLVFAAGVLLVFAVLAMWWMQRHGYKTAVWAPALAAAWERLRRLVASTPDA